MVWDWKDVTLCSNKTSQVYCFPCEREGKEKRAAIPQDDVQHTILCFQQQAWWWLAYDLMLTSHVVPVLHPYTFQWSHAKQESRKQPYNTDETLLKHLTCCFCVYKMSRTNSALESEFHFKTDYPPQVTADKKPAPSVNPTCFCQIRGTSAVPDHYSASLFIKRNPNAAALPFVRRSGAEVRGASIC